MSINTHLLEMVESAIIKLELDPATVRGEEKGQWNLFTGDIEVWIDLMPAPEGEGMYFQVMSPFCEIPSNLKEQFLSNILKLNYTMIESCFVLFEGGVYLRVIREIEFLNQDQCFYAINRIGYYATKFKQELFPKYLLKSIQHKEDLEEEK